MPHLFCLAGFVIIKNPKFLLILSRGFELMIRVDPHHVACKYVKSPDCSHRSYFTVVLIAPTSSSDDSNLLLLMLELCLLLCNMLDDIISQE